MILARRRPHPHDTRLQPWIVIVRLQRRDDARVRPAVALMGMDRNICMQDARHSGRILANRGEK